MEKKNNTGNDRTALVKKSNEKQNPAFHLFLFLVSFLSLGFMVFGILVSFFQAVNKFFPDSFKGRNFSSSYFDNDLMKFGLSSLIVTIPIYYGVLFLLNKKLEKKEIEEDSLVRKGITYLAMVAFSAMAIGSLVALLYSYFDGELTTRFVFKVMAFLVVSLFFFGFYFWEIRRVEFSKNSFNKLFFSSLVLTSIALILAFFVIDSPKTAREKRADGALIDNMREASRIVSNKYKGKDYFTKDNTQNILNKERIVLEMTKNKNSSEEIQKVLENLYGEMEVDVKELPKAEDIVGQISKNVSYQPLEDSKYKLCGNFKRTAKEDGAYPRENNEKWSHPKGNHCFVFDAEADEYSFDPIITEQY